MEFVGRTRFKKPSKKPLEMLQEWNEILDTKNARVEAHYISTGNIFLKTLQAQSTDNLQGLDHFQEFVLEEKFVPHGAEISINGTFKANQNSIDIGVGFSKTFHSLKFGANSRPSNRPIIQASILGLFFASSLAWATYTLMMLPKR